MTGLDVLGDDIFKYVFSSSSKLNLRPPDVYCVSEARILTWISVPSNYCELYTFKLHSPHNFIVVDFPTVNFSCKVFSVGHSV